MSVQNLWCKGVAGVGLGLVLLGAVARGAQETRPAVAVQPTRGTYLGQDWHIDANHLLWWSGKPYVRYGFTGNGDVDTFIDLGFAQFNACPSEALWAFSTDPAQNRQAIREVDEFTDELVRKGATYYANLNLLWPWRDSGKIASEDMVACVFRQVWDVTRLAGKGELTELRFASDTPITMSRDNATVYLFDFGAGRYRDISETLRSIQTTEKTVEESASERYRATVHTLTFEKMRMPDSAKLRITALIRVVAPMVPGVYPSSFPALWKPGIRTYYRNGLESFRKAYSKPALRGMMFGDEIDTHRVSLAHPGLHVDFSHDETALGPYRQWLRSRFASIGELNETLQTQHREFDEITWHTCIYPFPEDESEAMEETLSQQAFGLYESPEQFASLNQLQEEFRVWFYGHWLAQYAKMAQDVIGTVPVFLTSAGMPGHADGYLQIHKRAMEQGIEGLVRNHYAWVSKDADGRPITVAAGSQERFPLETITSLLDSVQQQTGLAKTYWANEFGHPQRGGDGFVDDFGLGGAFSFPSKQTLLDFLTVLIENGCKGFNMFKMNPNVPAARREVEWLSELRPQIVDMTVRTTEYRKLIQITKQQAISLARQSPALSTFLKERPKAQATASFNERYNVWIVEFIADGSKIAFASVGMNGRVLETETK